MPIKKSRYFLTLAATLAPIVVFAHHSAAVFDFQHPVELTGTVKNFLWGNPHAQLVLIVPNGQGGTDEWDVAGGSVNSLIRQGLTNSSMAPGMKVTLIIAPRRDGQHNAEFTKVVQIDDNGKIFTPEESQ